MFMLSTRSPQCEQAAHPFLPGVLFGQREPSVRLWSAINHHVINKDDEMILFTPWSAKPGANLTSAGFLEGFQCFLLLAGNSEDASSEK